ncbi:MAG: hypothetical protein ABSC11_09640 [Smithella sp.]|jgi:hypothetical protein
MKYSAWMVTVLILLALPVSIIAAPTTRETDFLIKQCKINEDDVTAIATMPRGGQDKLATIIKAQKCDDLAAFKDTRQYLKQFQSRPQPSLISRAPKDYDREFVSDKEFELMKSIINDFANDLSRIVVALSAQELQAIRKELSTLEPPATLEEADMYKKLKDDPVAVNGFVATRLYLRLIGFPGAIKIVPSEAPKVPNGVDYKYTLNFDEEFPLFQIFLSQGISQQRSPSK